MLDSDTKRRIDTARDILVGKVPDPKSQVEQITIALIYKFMNDMDAQNEELGGERLFFAGDFARYRWSELIRPGIGGYEMLNLYAEAITRMPENPGIPGLFRSIFNNAFLPYRDPETLRLFLKTIDEFNYDHPENLGDAYEYLLSVLGSQGDAGQFRTPRHIIDFIVGVIDPQKRETILDPACGTGGFLISAYRHVQQANTDERGDSLLTGDERQRLASNLLGYDISPDMVRLSLVNMYLHGLRAPNIAEYDTLTSEERWGEYADVIMANPPFMTPKGGIRPHNRFTVKSKRSEVLFVDYIAEHLTPAGRAGVIVPEGVIFQSQQAHTRLRKMLVEDYLVAVVSLPAGVFNPYSGVKTSILILDKYLAKRADGIAFFKVKNDGYDLGAQRRPIDRNDLPTVQAELAEYLLRLLNRESMDGFAPKLGMIVAKEKIIASVDYNLTAERYQHTPAQNSKFPYVRLDAVAEIVAGNPAPQGDKYFQDGEFPFIRTADVGAVHRSDNFAGAKDKVNQRAVDEKRLRLFPAGTILFPKSGASTFLNHRVVMGEPAYVTSHLAGIICDASKVLPKYVYNLLCKVDAREITPDQAYPSLRLTEIGAIEIPLPSLKTQQEIVAEIDGYQRVIEGARVVVDNWQPSIAISQEWATIKFSEVTKLVTPTAKLKTNQFNESGQYPIIDQSQKQTAGYTDDESTTTDAGYGAVIFGDHTCTVKFVVGKFTQGADGIKIIKTKDGLDPKFLYYWMKAHPLQATGYNRHYSDLKRMSVPITSLSTQQAIVADIESEQALVNANLELIERMEKRIATAIGRVWAT